MIEYVNECSVELINTNASDDMVAMAAWVSFDQDKAERLQDRDGIGKLIKFLYRNQHMSPFEHGQFIFKVDVPLFVAREFHRHRTMSYNEVSGRYTEMTPRFYVPPKNRPLVQDGKPGDYFFTPGSPDQYAYVQVQFDKVMEAAWDSYQIMLGEGIAKEVARQVLPLNLMTQFYATVNPRNLMHFLDLRNESHAIYEIQDVARKMESILEETMPLTYAAFRNEPIVVEEPVRNEPEMTVQQKALWRNGVEATLQGINVEEEIWDGTTKDIPLVTDINAGRIGDATISATKLRADYPTTNVVNVPENTVINVYVNDTNLNAKDVADAVYEALHRNNRTMLGHL